MTAPGQAAQFFLYGLLMGAGLGVVYGFLRPLRPGMTALADFLFVVAALFSWIYLAFGICACDIRPGYTLALAMGAILWEITFGKLLRPVFSLFWRIILWPLKKIFEISRKIYKFLLAIGKKWVTMIGTIVKEGGAANGKKALHKSGTQANKPRHKSRHSGRRHPISDRTGGTV